MYQLEEVKRELKSIASMKSRLKKQLGKVGTEKKLQEIIDKENKLREIKQSLENKKKSVPEYEWEDIENLSYEEVCRAINSIKSKKSLSRWLTDVEGDNDEYRRALYVEQLLYKRKAMVEETKTTIKQEIAILIEMSGELSKEELVEKLQGLL